MPRRKYKNDDARRRHVVKYTPVEYSSDYDVLMTNGSGVKTVRIAGSRVSAWNYAIRLGIRDEEMFPGTWWPIEMKFIKDNDGPFSVI